MKEITYQKEAIFLSPYAKKSIETLGRAREEEPCPMRTDFQRDRDRIIHSKSFRRLKNKTQVFFSPEGDHYRTRLTHTLDVSQIARSIARSLDLNEDLAEAIALGHDLGHTPFGHTGEHVLDDISTCGFKHNEQSLRVVDFLENDGLGLNLTVEVRDGILQHKKSGHPMTLEGQAVSLADRIAYLNHDIDDAERAGLLSREALPEKPISLLGINARERINTMITSIYNNSKGKPYVKMEEEIGNAMDTLRSFMFETVYTTGEAKAEENKAQQMLEIMFKHFKDNPEKIPELNRSMLERDGLERVICDYISSMSDRYAVYIFESLFIPKSWSLMN